MNYKMLKRSIELRGTAVFGINLCAFITVTPFIKHVVISSIVNIDVLIRSALTRENKYNRSRLELSSSLVLLSISLVSMLFFYVNAAK